MEPIGGLKEPTPPSEYHRICQLSAGLQILGDLLYGVSSFM